MGDDGSVETSRAAAPRDLRRRLVVARTPPAGETDVGGAVLRRRRRPIRSTRLGAQFDPLLPFEDWKELGTKLARYSNATPWWLGDWLAFGQMKYGRRYKKALAVTALDYQTLRNYTVVARRFELSRRRDNLSFQHHAEVCALPDDEQDRWLDLAMARGWSRNELRRNLRAVVCRDERTRALADSAFGPLDAGLLLKADQLHMEHWRAAADARHLEFDAWVIAALDEAAGRILRPRSRSRPTTRAHRGAADRDVHTVA
jgi:hypothetical protein